MSANPIVDAIDAASLVKDARTPRAFTHAVGEFIRVVGAVPDEYGPTLSAGAARTIQSLGDDVIDRIEERVSSADGSAQAQSLVSAVYEIRRLLEEVNRTRHHYTVARSL